MNKAQLAEIAARNQERPNEDVTALLTEVQALRDRQMTFIRWAAEGVLPKLKAVWRVLLYQKPRPAECLTLDKAIGKLEGDLGWLALFLDESDGGTETLSKSERNPDANSRIPETT